MKKKFIALLLALAMVFCFAACGNNGADDSDVDAGMPNPMVAIDSLEALNEAFGCAMITPTVAEITDEEFYSIDGDPQLAQYNFKANGYECTLRFAVAGMDTDISGYYKEDGTTVFQNSDSDVLSYENEQKHHNIA